MDKLVVYCTFYDFTDEMSGEMYVHDVVFTMGVLVHPFKGQRARIHGVGARRVAPQLLHGLDRPQ